MATLDPEPDYAIIQPTPERRVKRPDDIAERIKDLMVEHALGPGDRLPGERELMEQFQASKSTVREALKALDTQGLIRARSGPGGGVFVAELSGGRAMELLGNYFFFRQPSIRDIYAVRVELEPELAASVVGILTDADFRRLQNTMRLYEKPPADRGEEYQQRLAELDFHSALAELSPNPILGFICGFMHNLLRNLTICRQIYAMPNPELREQGLHYQVRLLRALEGQRCRRREGHHARAYARRARLHGGMRSLVHRRISQAERQAALIARGGTPPGRNWYHCCESSRRAAAGREHAWSGTRPRQWEKAPAAFMISDLKCFSRNGTRPGGQDTTSADTTAALLPGNAGAASQKGLSQTSRPPLLSVAATLRRGRANPHPHSILNQGDRPT